MNKPKPPKYPLRFLQWFCKDQLQESILGDLDEQFREDVEKYGVRKARRKYAWNAVRFFRPGIVTAFGGDLRMNAFDLFQSHVKTSLRSIRRNMLFSSINVVGLAISLSIVVLMIVFLNELSSFDGFHEKGNRIYHVVSDVSFSDKKFASSSIYIGDRIRHEVPGVEEVAIQGYDLDVDLVFEDKILAIEGVFASEGFCNVFSFPLLKGNPSSALSEPNSIVLTNSMAKKLFGDEDPVGKVIAVKGSYYFNSAIITGVMQDPPYNSHIQFEALASMTTMAKKVEGISRHFMNNRENIWNSHIYLLLEDQASAYDVQQAIYAINEIDNSESDRKINNELQPLSEVIPSKGYQNQFGPQFPERLVWIMIILTLVVVLSASFNYTNLSLARALRRSKEVGVRKVTGASRLQVFGQFIMESTLLTAMASVLGIILFFIIRPYVLSFRLPGADDMFRLLLDHHALIQLLIVIILVGSVAGLIPALFLSKLKARIVLKDASKINLGAGVSVRHGLVFFQFVLSIALIAFSLVVYRQYQFAINYDLGYKTDNILQIHGRPESLKLLQAELEQIPEVISSGRGDLILGVRWDHRETAVSDDRVDTVQYSLNHVYGQYLQVHDLDLIAGHGFSHKSDSNEMVINMHFVKSLKIENPYEAIGQHVWSDKIRYKVVGVVDNFVNVSLYSEPAPFAFVGGKDDLPILSIRLNTNYIPATVEKIEAAYKKVDPYHIFEAHFYDEKIQSTYEEHKVSYTVVSFLAFLAITISSLGTLGMAVFTAESRMKEISIRKILGASAKGLIMLMSRSYMLLILLAGVFAIPLTWYLLEDKVLNEFVYRIDINPVEMFFGFFLVLVIVLVTMSWQITVATRQNPADLLRDE